MKKPALTVGAITVLSQGVSLANNSSNTVNKHEIRVDEVSSIDRSTGSAVPDSCFYDPQEHPYMTVDPQSGDPIPDPRSSRKILAISVHASATAWDGSATCAISIVVGEDAQYKPNPVTEPNIWADMSAAQFEAHRGGERDVHVVNMTLQKRINSVTGIVTVTARSEDYNETDAGIDVTAAWAGDSLASRQQCFTPDTCDAVHGRSSFANF